MDQAELHAQLEELHRNSFGWALSCCGGDPLEAEDVLQATYVKILQGKARYGGRSAFKTWLFAVIRNTAADHRRRRIVGRVFLRKHEKRVPRSTQPERSDTALYRREIRGLFRDALAALPRRQREVLQLVFVHDHTLREAAEVMGISVGSVRTHYHRAKERLRRWLEEAEIHDASGLRQDDRQALPRAEA